MFDERFDSRFAWADGDGSGAFGTNVLAGLIEGIDDFLAQATADRRSRSLGPGLLGAFMWVDDAELADRIATFPSACVVVTKQSRDKRQAARTETLKTAVADGNGFPARALPRLAKLWPHEEDGSAPVVGPSSHREDVKLSPLRALGFRREGKELVPILHTKMLLLGDLWWHDEGPLGNVEDVIGFTPRRLWLGSANGTQSSHGSLEFGVWLQDRQAMAAALSFLQEVIAHSEELDPDSNTLTPELVEPDYDDDEMARAYG